MTTKWARSSNSKKTAADPSSIALFNILNVSGPQASSSLGKKTSSRSRRRSSVKEGLSGVSALQRILSVDSERRDPRHTPTEKSIDETAVISEALRQVERLEAMADQQNRQERKNKKPTRRTKSSDDASTLSTSSSSRRSKDRMCQSSRYAPFICECTAPPPPQHMNIMHKY